MKGLLAPQFEKPFLVMPRCGRCSGQRSQECAGCYVCGSKIHRSSEVRIVRDGIVVHEGKLASLRRFKDDVREVAAGYECGIGLERFNDIKENDIIEAFEMTEIERG